jgi:hypothetical protein
MDEYERTRRRRDLVYDATVTPSRIHNVRARQHLREGFNRRVLMLDASLQFVLENTRQQDGEPISVYVATDLAIHLNALYLNLCGALDNLAWALQYEHQLIQSAEESSGRQRLQINLFNSKFLRALEAVAGTLVTAIREHDGWYRDLRDLRDPAAHRIPIYAVPGVMTGQQANEFAELQAKAADLFNAGDHDGGMDLIHKSTTIGTYKPLMILSHEAGLEPRDIRVQVQEDDYHFVAVAELVLRHLFAPRTTTGSA